MRIAAILRVAGLAGVAAVLVGCGVSPTAPTVTTKPAAISGKVFGGQQPITGATIQLYTVGTSGDGVGSSPLLTQTVTTDGNGNFNITGLYSCSSATQVYMTSTGGYVSGVQNANATLMAALGACTSLNAATYITMNELTTVAAVNALYPYMSVTAGSAPVVGSGTSDVGALDAGFTLAGEFVNTATGVAPGNVPTGYVAPVAEINTLGDAMANCVNSGGGVANDGTGCGNFFGMTTPTSGTAPVDTVGALLNLAKNPALNTSGLYASASPTSPFQPQLAAQPVDFSVALTPVLSLQVSPVSVSFPSTTVSTTAGAIPVTIYNSSAAGTVTLSSIAITGANASEFSLSNGCGSALIAGAGCTVQVSATPTATGAQSASLVVTSNASGSPQSVPLAITGLALGVGGSVSLSATTLGWTLAKTYQDVTLTNNGSVPIVFTSSTGTTAFTTNNTGSCGGVIPALGSCVVTVESLGYGVTNFYGTYSLNTYADTLTITSNASNSPQSVTLLSKNQANVGFQLNGSIVSGAFGEVGVGSSTSESVVLNGFYYTGINTNYSVGGTNPGDFTTPDCSATVSGYAQFGNCSGSQQSVCSAISDNGCAGTLMFTPSAGGTRSARLYFSGSAVVNGTSFTANEYVPLSGTAPTGTSFTASTPTFGYSYVYQTTPATATSSITVTNTGAAVLNPTNFSLTGTNPSNFSVTGNTCSGLKSLATCTVSVAFSASSVGSYAASLTITDVASGTSQVVPLSATASAYPPIKISPSTISFSNQVVGTMSAAQIFTVSDINGNPLNHPVTVTAPADGYFVLPGGSSCAASSTQLCTLSVAFNPTTTTNISGDILTATDVTSGFTATSSLYASSGVVPVLVVSPTSYTFPSTAVNSSSAREAITVQTTVYPSVPFVLNSLTITGIVNNNFTITNYCGTGSSSQISGCVIYVTFTPSVAGTQSMTITLNTNASNSPTTVTLTGTAH